MLLKIRGMAETIGKQIKLDQLISEATKEGSILTVDSEPRLVIFGGKEYQKKGNWDFHRNILEKIIPCLVFSNKPFRLYTAGNGRLTGVQLTVHRATREIGGNCIELSTSDGHRIILDVGRPLDAPQEARQFLPKSLDLNAAVDGVLITHPHQDHYGLLEDVPAGWPIYSGAATERLIRLSSAIFGKELPHAFHPWKAAPNSRSGRSRNTFLIDHSAFDAYMLLIEV